MAKRQMQHLFSRVPSADIPRSSFNRSHGYKTTFDAGYLIPVFFDEALPGDTFNCRMTAFGRLATPIFPLMDNIYLDTFFFAVPIRLIWDNWEKFNGAQDNPGDSTDFTVPVMQAPAGTGHASGSLSDFFGIPVGQPLLEHNSLHHRAYNLIYNDWFRDQNLQDSVVVDKDDGPDDPTDYVPLRRGKRHDYFTSCLPWPQKGDAIELPIGSTAPVTGIGKSDQTFGAGSVNVYETAGSGTTNFASSAAINYGAANSDFFIENDPNNTGYPGIYADLSAATASTVNALRQAFQLQKMLERDARGGTRYTEIVRSHFGVISPDARLQRPEYLGGGSTPVNVNPVAQTSSTDGTSPQGNLSAYGTVAASRHGFTKSFTEHCVLLGLVSIRADLNYQQGLNRMWSRQTRYDFFWPALAQIGEQAVLSKEIFADASANDEDVFGYQERYAEYRYKPSVITNQMRSAHATPLDAWHLAQDFASRPVLDETFIQETPPMDRVLAVPAEPDMLLDCWFDLKCARPMPVFGVPGMIDHF